MLEEWLESNFLSGLHVVMISAFIVQVSKSTLYELTTLVSSS